MNRAPFLHHRTHMRCLICVHTWRTLCSRRSPQSPRHTRLLRLRRLPPPPTCMPSWPRDISITPTVACFSPAWLSCQQWRGRGHGTPRSEPDASLTSRVGDLRCLCAWHTVCGAVPLQVGARDTGWTQESISITGIPERNFGLQRWCQLHVVGGVARVHPVLKVHARAVSRCPVLRTAQWFSCYHYFVLGSLCEYIGRGSSHRQGQPGGVRTFFEISVGPLGLTHARVARGIFTLGPL